MRFPKSHLRAFSLMELLVVVGLIAMLIGLLIPGLRFARDSSRQTLCASNIRQLVLANIAYTNDHKGRFAPGASNFIANLDRWHGRRINVNERFEPKRGALSAFLGPDGAVRHCPSFDPDRTQPGSDFEAGAGGFGYNNAYIGVDERLGDGRGARAADVAHAFETVMFSDTAFAQAFPNVRTIEYSFSEPVFQRRNESYELDASIHFRHREARANIAWADGHVGPEEFAFTRRSVYGVTKVQMMELYIGWFGPESNDYFDLD